MTFKQAIASVGAAALLCLAGSHTAASQPDLNTQLQAAVNAQEWDNAIAIVDRLIATQGESSALVDYRQRLQSLASEQATSTSPTTVATLDGIPLTTISDQLNQTLPIQLDEHTELVSTSASGNRLSYQGRMLELVVDDLEASRFNSRFFKDSFARIICPNPEISYVLERGIELEYVLVDRNNSPLVTVEVTSQTCQV